MDKRDDSTIVKYLQLIEERFRSVEQAYLFGSYVNGKSTENSDIDLALIFKELDDSKRFETQVDLLLLASEVDNRIEPHPISHEDFYSQNPFAKEIKRTGVEVSADVIEKH